MNNLSNKILIYDALSSTSTLLKSMAREGAEDGTVIISKVQTGGRGRLGKSFFSPEGGLYLSYLMHPKTLPEETAEITMCTGAVVRRVIGEQCGIWADIKYVNDLLYNGKKLCGILAELIEGNLIIGIGINVNNKAEVFPPELRDIVISISDILGEDVSPAELHLPLISALNDLNSTWPNCKKNLLDEYLKYCCTNF